MEPGSFQRLLGAIRAASFSAEKRRVIEQAAAANFFLVAQCKDIVKSLSFSADQVRAVELIAPRLLDRQNAFELYDVFTFSADKEQVQRILDRTARAEPAPPPSPPPPPPAPASSPYVCSSSRDCTLACPSAAGCCGWPCGCSHAIRREHRAAYEARYAATCRRHPQCPAVACARREMVAACRDGRCVAEEAMTGLR
jgi:hypothetical protein